MRFNLNYVYFVTFLVFREELERCENSFTTKTNIIHLCSLSLWLRQHDFLYHYRMYLRFADFKKYDKPTYASNIWYI